MDILARRYGINSSRLFFLRSLRIRTKLLLSLIPSTILILVVTGFMANWLSSLFFDEAIRSNVRMGTLALAHEVEIYLDQCRTDLLLLSRGPINKEVLCNFWNSQKKINGWGYVSVAFLTTDPEECIYLVGQNEDAVTIPTSDIPQVQPDPRSGLETISLNSEEVWISKVQAVSFPVTSQNQLRATTIRNVIRFMTLVKREGAADGVLLLSIDAFQLRDILSQFVSSKSPIFHSTASPQSRHSFLFGLDGWIWFQSEEDTSPLTRLSGTFGNPGLPSAFKPFSEHVDYWEMVEGIRNDRMGLVTVHDHHSTPSQDYYVGYAPVKFEGSGRAVFAGVAFADRSSVGMLGKYRLIDVMIVIALGCALLLSVVIVHQCSSITRPLFELTSAVKRVHESEELQDIRLQDQDFETNVIADAINGLFSKIRGQIDEIKLKDEQLLAAAQSEKVRLEEEISALKKTFMVQNIDEILGMSPALEALKMEISKAASVDADVLVTGETGTGKELAAKAIHRLSGRSRSPFVSVNCGALNENLLMDELFGHVKGAFTEARNDRRGAFLAADGGILFLDEIGNASPKVQQSLLRALAMKKVTPLGSDIEYDADVRVVAATNRDLLEMVKRGSFREDLYYRLKVIMIVTPPLRDRREDILILANHFLKDAATRMGRKEIGLTRGALDRLRAYDWPGNVRELQNCITGAVAMAENSLIHAHDIQLDEERLSHHTVSEGPLVSAPSTISGSQDKEYSLPEGVSLNERQKRAVSLILSGKEISRSEYQKLVGGALPTRTAVYDLQDLVRKGVLEMCGRGPTTRYRLLQPKQASTPAVER